MIPSKSVSYSIEIDTEPDVSHETSEEWTFDTLISYLAQKYNQDEVLMRKIISCESANKKNAKHDNYTEDGQYWSSDIGYVQVNTYWHEEAATERGFNIYNWQDNLEYGFILLKSDGADRHWSASAYCWKDENNMSKL